MKKIFFAAVFTVLASAGFSHTPSEVNEKVLKAFKETFTNATNVAWLESNNYYEANFKQSAITTRARYDVEGNLLSTIRYYYEENLPSFITAKLKKKYPGKSVFGVTETANEDEVLYYIKLEDDKNWYTIKSDNLARFEMTEKYKKS
ncbi:MAG: hypothetical protein EPN92_14310 [Chitinophagaceae bacterium]|nr:MAG: hypothetical protein EPN92_14310 [Chitinophagaceae bacterium]